MSPPATATGPDRLTTPEINLLLLLDGAGMKFHGRDGSIRWALTPDDVCCLLELAAELLPAWGATTPLAAWVRAARLLCVPVPADLDDHARDAAQDPTENA
jgi:hypothetical protein